MKNIIKACLYLMRKNKVQIIFFPIYLLYILIFYFGLGMGDDIWDDAIKEISRE
ncbi:hypothetical protein CACET_c08380 [Clostridium aceticum]|uniref:Uncharacterized protein n=1 Tax=Clostridium aceticum TaxID=84022 RepID=A0A0G3W8W2_9CLOT|nr:hypothetical protein [Clostridium aceticum]AKL94347.1 hypothetical protein CACET_c08380 [Clostridium aceticum]